MINSIIIDDEPSCIRSLAFDLEKYCPQVNVVEKCTNAKDGLLAIKKLKPDLVFFRHQHALDVRSGTIGSPG